MHTALTIALIIVSIALIVVVLMQPSKTDGLNAFSMGGNGDTFFSKNKSRTYEALLARLTVIFAIIFVGIIVALNIIK